MSSLEENPKSKKATGAHIFGVDTVPDPLGTPLVVPGPSKPGGISALESFKAKRAAEAALKEVKDAELSSVTQKPVQKERKHPAFFNSSDPNHASATIKSPKEGDLRNPPMVYDDSKRHPGSGLKMVDDESTRAPIPSQAPKSAGSFPVDDTPNDLTTWDLIVYKSMLYSSMGKLQGEIVYLQYVVMKKKRSFGVAVYNSLDSENSFGPETSLLFEKCKRDIVELLEQIKHNERELAQLNLTGEGQTVSKPRSPRKGSPRPTNNGNRLRRSEGEKPTQPPKDPDLSSGFPAAAPVSQPTATPQAGGRIMRRLGLQRQGEDEKSDVLLDVAGGTAASPTTPKGADGLAGRLLRRLRQQGVGASGTSQQDVNADAQVKAEPLPPVLRLAKAAADQVHRGVSSAVDVAKLILDADSDERALNAASAGLNAQSSAESLIIAAGAAIMQAASAGAMYGSQSAKAAAVKASAAKAAPEDAKSQKGSTSKRSAFGSSFGFSSKSVKGDDAKTSHAVSPNEASQTAQVQKIRSTEDEGRSMVTLADSPQLPVALQRLAIMNTSAATEDSLLGRFRKAVEYLIPKKVPLEERIARVKDRLKTHKSLGMPGSGFPDVPKLGTGIGSKNSQGISGMNLSSMGSGLDSTRIILTSLAELIKGIEEAESGATLTDKAVAAGDEETSLKCIAQSTSSLAKAAASARVGATVANGMAAARLTAKTAGDASKFASNFSKKTRGDSDKALEGPAPSAPAATGTAL